MAKSDRTEIEHLIAKFRVDDPAQFRLADCDPANTDGVKSKDAAHARLADGITRLAELQARLAAQDTYGLLVVLQALDAAGKDGAIGHVMTGLNPQGVKVHSFKTPAHEELAHPYLWRTSNVLPRRGEIGIFNRSHYEEVLFVRVHPDFLAAQHLPKSSTKGDVWQRRFGEINDWERMLVDNGFPVVKLFLHVSKAEQRRRLLARIDTPEKNWKFSMDDVHERQHWDDYQAAYDDLIRHTSTSIAPWYVVPADHKWFTRLIVAEAVGAALMDIDPRFPTLSPDQLAQLATARTALEAS